MATNMAKKSGLNQKKKNKIPTYQAIFTLVNTRKKTSGKKIWLKQTSSLTGCQVKQLPLLVQV